MSWQAYVDTSLVGTGTVDQAAILSVAGDSVWASTPGFQVSPTEVKTIIAGFNDPSKMYAEGVRVGNIKYTVFKAEEGSIYGRHGKVGVVIVKTKQSILVAHHPDTVPSQSCISTVETLGDYLKGQNY